MIKKFTASILTATLLISTFLFAPAAHAAAILGDVDGDGTIQSSDARLALRASVGLEQLTEEQKKAADADLNGKIESADARLILRASVGLQTLACEHKFGKWEPEITSDGENTDFHVRTCELCKTTEKGSHNYELKVISHGTCDQTGIALEVCKDCGAQGNHITTAPEHDWETVSETPATCTEDGVLQKKCKLCGELSDEILPKGHVSSGGATCTENEICTRCEKVLSPALGHTYSSSKSVSVTKGILCDRCGETAVPCFNDLVNVLKDGKHTFTGVSKDVINFENPEFTGIMIAFKGQFEKEFKDMVGTTTEYSDITGPTLINKYNYSVAGSTSVSLLSEDDVLSVKTEYVSGVDFVKAFPNTATTTGGKTIDLTEFKNKKFGDLMKVTVTLKPENYTDVADKGGSVVIDKIYSGYGDTLRETMQGLELGMGTDDILRFDGSCISSARVIFYFDKTTLDPVAADYYINMDMEQTFNLYITDDGEASSKPTGSIKMNSKTDLCMYYFYDVKA